MPFVKLWVHLIFATKKRESLITDNIKSVLIEHLLINAREKGIYIDFLNTAKDHIHILLSLGTEQNISKIVQLIKGESSFWINKNKISKYKFEWQDEYIALSVSSSAVNKVREYIKNQEEHHRKISFSEEYEMFLQKIEKFG